MTTASSMTYDSLVSDITSYAERSDVPFSDQIPRFIMLAENRIASEVKGLGLLKVVSGNLSISNPVLVKPERWRETVSFNITSGTERVTLKERTYEYCRAFWPDESQKSVPRFYSDYDYEHFFIVPTPLIGYALELKYYERPEPLSSQNQTTWTTQYAPQLLFNACMIEAVTFLKRYDTIPIYKTAYEEARTSIQAEAKRRVFDRSTAVRE